MDVTINLSETEIHEAIKDFVENKAPIRISGALSVNIVAGRGTANTSAIITISDAVEIKESVVEEKSTKKPKVAKEVTPDSPFEENFKPEDTSSVENIFGAPHSENSETAELLFGNA